VIPLTIEQLKGDQKAILEEEKKYVQAKVVREQAELEEKQALAKLKKKQNQGDILSQVQAKERDKRREEQEKMYERRAAMLAELDYKKKIAAVKDRTEKEVQTLKSTKGMSNYAAAAPTH
jgi:hypothetical protein